MNASELELFMEQYKLTVDDIAQIAMTTKWAVYKWLDGSRKMSPLTNRILLESRK